MSARQFPDDVFEESCSRLPVPRREDLPDAAKELFDYFHDPHGGTYAGIRGPSCIRLHSPELLVLSVPVSRYVRYQAGIAEDVRELAILVTGRAFDSQFEWTAHEPLALEAGVTQATVDAIKYRKDLAGLAELDAAVIQLGREIFAERRVSSATFARALALFGRRTLVDLVSLMANYAGTAALLCAFDLRIRPGKEPLLPEV